MAYYAKILGIVTLETAQSSRPATSTKRRQTPSQSEISAVQLRELDIGRFDDVMSACIGRTQTRINSKLIVCEPPHGFTVRVDLIGKGSFKTAYKAIQFSRIRDNGEISFKESDHVIFELNDTDPEEKKRQIEKEIRIQSKLGPDFSRYVHQNSVVLNESDDLVNAVSLSKRMKGTLSDISNQSIGIIKRRLAEVACGVAQLHTVGVFHNDIKPDNILLPLASEPSQAAKIADLGEASLDDSDRHELAGSPMYMSPESYAQGQPASEKKDVYAYGMTILAILSKRGEASPQPNNEYTKYTTLYRTYSKCIQPFVPLLLRGEGSDIKLCSVNLQKGLQRLQSEFCGGRDLYHNQSRDSCSMLQSAIMCLDPEPKDRPSMTQVSTDLGLQCTDRKSPKSK